MDAFLQTFGAVVALVFGIVIVSIFFSSLGRFNRFLDDKKVIRLPGLGPDLKLVNVHLIDGFILEKMKVHGLARSTRSTALPHIVSQMLVLEDSNGLKSYLKSDLIKIIQELPTVKTL